MLPPVQDDLWMFNRVCPVIRRRRRLTRGLVSRVCYGRVILISEYVPLSDGEIQFG